MRVMKHYVANKALFETWKWVNENKVLSYYEALTYDVKDKKVPYVKLTNLLSF